MNVPRIIPTLLAAIAFACVASVHAADQSVWPLTPYEVRVYVAVAQGEPSLAPPIEADLCADLASRIEAVVGAPWNVTILPAPPELARTMLRGLGALKSDEIPIASPEGDKILLLAVTASPGRFTVTARDFDVRTHTLSATVARPVWLPGELCGASLDALLSAFAPLARVDRIEKDKETMLLRVKAAGLPTRDPNLPIVRVGDVFRPIVRYNDRDNKLRRLVPSQWSFVVVEKISPEDVQCRIHTGMRSEINMKGRGRVEPLALRVRSPGGGTVLTLQSRTEPKSPLAGCDVYSYPPGKKDAATLLGRTDRQGRLFVPPAEGEPMRILLVKHGSAALAKLPVIPGLDTQATVELAKDDQRLAAEGFLAGLEEELVDLVARRKILIARIRGRLAADQFDEASALLAELRRLPTSQYFSLRFAREQDKLASNDRVIQKKISFLMRNFKPQMEKYLNPSEIEAIEREVRVARDAGPKRADAAEGGE